MPPDAVTEGQSGWQQDGYLNKTPTSAAGSSVGTLANAPHAGPPDFWLPVVVNGLKYAYPLWRAR
jgi:hypothetical protein